MRFQVQRFAVDHDVTCATVREANAVHSPLFLLAPELQADVGRDFLAVTICTLTGGKLQHSTLWNRSAVQRVCSDNFVGVLDLAHVIPRYKN